MSEGDDRAAFAGYLRMLKNRTGRSYAALANRIGVSDSALHRYCTGGNPPPTFAVVVQIAREFGAGRDELLELRRLWTLADAARGGQGPEAVPEPVQLPVAITRPARRSRRPLVLASLALTICLLLAGGGFLLWPAPPTPARPGPPPSGSRVGCWSFGDGGALTAPCEGNAQLTVFGEAEMVAEPIGRVVSMAGNGELSTTGPVVRTDADYTISMWVRLMDFRASRSTVVSQDDGRTSGFRLYYDNRWRSWAFSVAHVGQETTTYSLKQARPGDWTHLIAVHDAGRNQITLHLDGTEEMTQPLRGRAWHADGPLRIGGARDNGVRVDGWHGEIDELIVFDRVITFYEADALSLARARDGEP